MCYAYKMEGLQQHLSIHMLWIRANFQISFLTSQIPMYSNFLSNDGSQSLSCFSLICRMMPVFGGAELVFF